MQRVAIFIDDGGVMSDNRLRGPQWQKMVADFFAPRLGGAVQEWAAANYKVITSILEPEAWQVRLRAASDYESFERQYLLDWLGEMCRIVGVSQPSPEESIEMSRQAIAWIIPQVRAAFPGAPQAIRQLYLAGHALYTASGEPSYDLEGYLGPMGVRDCFARLYGPDLIDTFKVGPEFYKRMFADAGVAAAEALVVDDNIEALAWAASLGASTVLVRTSAPAGSDGLARIDSLADLPWALDGIVPDSELRSG